MNKIQSPYRYDVVGSFLRPQALKEARKHFEEGTITKDELRQIEDEEITELVKKEKKAGLHVISDGEFRRSSWHLDFMWDFDGVGHSKTETGLPFHDEAAMLDDTYLTGKISVGHHSFVDHFKFLKKFEDEQTVAKITIPAPAQFMEQFIMPFAWKNSKKYYASWNDLADDVVSAYRKVINELYEAGCRNLQLDDCSWGMLVDPRAKDIFGVDDAGLEEIKALFLDVNNRAIEGRPSDLIVNTHVCRGNFHSTYANEGGYDSVASYLFEKENVDGYFLEFDDERSGGFEPLKYVSGNKKVVLGLVTTKRADLETAESVVERIKKASQYIGLDRLAVSPQCGFASCEIGNKLTEDEQWDKVKLVKEVAESVWNV